jgi:flagellar biosynthesis/type III secretory pathway M-ring protein FliF/YscJ
MESNYRRFGQDEYAKPWHQGPLGWLLATAGTVCIVLVAYAIWVQIVIGRVETMGKNITQSGSEALARIQRDAQLAEERRRQAEAEKLALVRAEQQARADALTQQAQQERRKQAAFDAFYKKSPVCDNPPNHDALIECGNAYMRAKKQFEAKWTSGGAR